MGRIRSVVIRLDVEPSRPAVTHARFWKGDSGTPAAVHEYYDESVQAGYPAGGAQPIRTIELGCFAGISVRRGGARRGIVAGIVEGALDAYRARGAPCAVNRILDTRMTMDEFMDAQEPRRPAEGSRIDKECAVSPREAGIGIRCPRCGKTTTMARRGRYPRDAHAEAGMAEWRLRGLGGEPRPTLQWVRPHGKCEASNSHSLVILPAGAPRSGEFRGGFVLARIFGAEERIPHVYGAG